jgi:hypothetical protein
MANMSEKTASRRRQSLRQRHEAGPPISRKQAEHFATLLAALDACDHAQDLADERAALGRGDREVQDLIAADPVRKLARKMRACATGDRFVPRCRHAQCPRCRRHHVGRRIDDALRVFGALPAHRVFWVSVLVSVSAELFEPRVQTNLIDSRLPTQREVAHRIRRDITASRAKIDGAIKALKPETYAADGAFEFCVIDPRSCGAQKTRFLQDMGVKTGADADAHQQDVLLLHAHFVCAVKRKRGYATAMAITRALKKKFPGRRRVFVKGLDSRKVLPTNVRKLVGYSLKAFSDFRPERAVEVARVLEAVGTRSMSYVRRIGMGQKSSRGSASKAGGPEGSDHHRRIASAMAATASASRS